MKRTARSGKTKTPIWSGFWWPMLTDPERPGYRNLYEKDGPLALYDQFCQRSGLRDLHTKDFERWRHWADRRLESATGMKTFWWGHCNGWAAASVLEPEPQQLVSVQDLDFGVGSLKGLLTLCHNGDPVDVIHGLGDNDAHLFHSLILQSVGTESRGIVLDTKLDPKDPETGQRIREVWNYPAYKYSCSYKPGRGGKTLVEMNLWFANDAVQLDYVGVLNWPEAGKPKVYRYWLEGDPEHPTAGQWMEESEEDHPDLIWRPQSLAVQNAEEEKDPGSSQSDYHPLRRRVVYSIVAGNKYIPQPSDRREDDVDMFWDITEDEEKSFPPAWELGNWWRFRVSLRDSLRPYDVELRVVGDDRSTWQVELQVVGDPIIHLVCFDKDTLALSDTAPHPYGYIGTHRGKVTSHEPALFSNSPLRFLFSQAPYAWERAGLEPSVQEQLPIFARPVACRWLPVGKGKQLWMDGNLQAEYGNPRGMWVQCELDRMSATMVSFG